MNILTDIPRFDTALAEWLACLICIIVLRHRFKGIKLFVASAAALTIQAVFLQLTGNVPIAFWVPCMMTAVLLMFGYISLCCNLSFADSAYSSIRAFVFAEFAASFQWQIYYFFFGQKDLHIVGKVLVLLFIYALVYSLYYILEKRILPGDGTLNIGYRGLVGAVVIGIAVFAISNLSFVSQHTLFSAQYSEEIFAIRTLVDLGGLSMLYAHYYQFCGFRARRELEIMQSMFENQYQQYQHSKESIEIINYKYHDLKHQIAALLAEEDSEKRRVYLKEMENDLKTYEIQNKTGNKVLDIILTSKNIICLKNSIVLTSVIDGALLDFIEVKDICSIFGNAMDNAIEYERKINESEKRLIHLSVFAQKGFLIIRIENYFEGELDFEADLPLTTKKDKDYHGYGLKSIRHIVQKYGGVLNTDIQDGWFELKILIPL